MSHDLAFKNGEARFAFNEREDPWHRLGKSVPKELTTLDDMLRYANADYQVSRTRVVATDDEGQPLYNGFDADGLPQWVYITNSQATIGQDRDGLYFGLSTVGLKYREGQNRDALALALAIVGETDQSAIVDTVGVLDEGRRFFATILLDDLILDLPDGVTDEIGRFIGVETSHDGTKALMIDNGNVRRVCANTCRLASRTARSSFKVRHTKSGENVDVGTARTALKISLKWADEFKAQAEALAAVPVTPTLRDRVIFTLWPEPSEDASDRQVENHDKIVTTVRGLYAHDRNAGKYGENGWSLYNAVGEYLDHYRPGGDILRAEASMDETSEATKKKFKAQALILAR